MLTLSQTGSSENIIVHSDGSLTFNGVQYIPIEPVIQESRSIGSPIIGELPCQCNDDDCSNCDY